MPRWSCAVTAQHTASYTGPTVAEVASYTGRTVAEVASYTGRTVPHALHLQAFLMDWLLLALPCAVTQANSELN